MSEEDTEDQLRAHQAGRVYPLGRALRETYHADNHDTLGSDVTGLMIDLSKVPFEPAAIDGHAVRETPALPRSWRDRIAGLWSSRRHPA